MHIIVNNFVRHQIKMMLKVKGQNGNNKENTQAGRKYKKHTLSV